MGGFLAGTEVDYPLVFFLRSCAGALALSEHFLLLISDMDCYMSACEVAIGAGLQAMVTCLI